MPFGFGRSDPDDPGDDAPSGAFGFGAIPGLPGGAGGPGGFDIKQLGQMLSQLGQMLSQSSPSAGPVNYDLAKQMATQRLTATGASSTTEAQQRAVTDAVRLAELWLETATTLPAGVRKVEAWSPQDWVEATLPAWRRLCDPVAKRVSGAWVEGLPEEARQMAGPMLAMVGQVGGLAFGSQLGTGLGQLGAEVLTSTEVGLPLGPEGTAALLPAAVQRFTAGVDRPAREVLVFLAAREAAHHRLFAHVPWLRQRLLATVEEFAQGIRVDTTRIEELARDLNPADPSALEEAMRTGLFAPQTTPAQQAALRRLEALLALVEGWVDVVVADAVGDRLPGAGALRETLRRRRASGGPAEQTFAKLVGLELRPRKLRAAADLWRRLGEQRGIEGRDAVWEHPDLVPTADDLDDPEAFLDRRDLGGDPFAELERTEGGSAREDGAPARDEATDQDGE